MGGGTSKTQTQTQTHTLAQNFVSQRVDSIGNQPVS